MYKTIQFSPNISFVDGKITEDSVNNIIEETSTELEDFSNIIGTTVNSVASSIIPYISQQKNQHIPHIKYGILLNSCSETFTNNSLKVLLSLVPDEPSNLNFSDVSRSYTSSTVFTSNNQYTVIGRTIYFSELAQSDFTVTYNGYLPEDYGADINYQTLYPNPKSILLNEVNKPTLEVLDSVLKIYSLTIDNETKIKDKDISFQSPLPSSIPEILQEYVSSNGSILTPLDYVGVWKLNSANSYERVNILNFKIISANTFIFQSTDVLSTSGTYIVSLFSKSLISLLNELYVAYKNHNHDDFGNTKKILHDNLLIDNEVDYHPQYLKRTGYDNDKNLITGDLLIGSEDTSNNNSNTIEVSRKIVFGDYNTGHAIYRENGTLGFLKIESKDSNGLDIVTNTPLEGNTGPVFLKSLSASFSNKKESNTLDTSLIINGGYNLFLDSTNFVFINNADIFNLKIRENGKININGIEINSVSSGAEIVSTNNKKLTFKNGVVFEGANIKSLLLNNGDYIKYVNDNDKIYATENGPKISYRIGISDYSSVEVVSEDNSLPAELSNYTKIESSNGVYFLRRIANGFNYNSNIYNFRTPGVGVINVEKIQDWPRQDLYSGVGNFYNISILDSDFTKRKGVNFGNVGKIYSISTSETCQPGSIVIESTEDVILLKNNTNTSNCDTAKLAGLKVNNISSSGEILAISNITSEESLISKTLEVTEDATIGGDVSIGGIISAKEVVSSENTKVGGTLYSKDIENNSKIKTQSVEVADNILVGGYLEVKKDTSITGNINISGGIISDKDAIIKGNITTPKLNAQIGKFISLSTEEDIIANGTVSSVNSLVKLELEVGNKITAGEINTKKASIDELATLTINVDSIKIQKNLSVGTIQTTSNIETGGSLSVKDNLYLGKSLTVNENIKVFGESILKGKIAFSEGLEGIGDFTLKGNISTVGKFTIEGNSIFDGSITIKNGNTISAIDSNLIIKNIEVKEKASFTDLQINNILFNNNIYGSEETKLSSGEIYTGSITLAERKNKNDSLTSYVDAKFMKNIYVANTINANKILVDSVISLTDTNEDKVFLTTSGLHFSKEEAILGIKNATIGKIIGRNDIQFTELSSFTNTSSEAVGLIDAIQKSKFLEIDNLSVNGILNIPRSLVVSGALYFNKILPLDSTRGYVDIIAGGAVYG